MHYQPWAAPKDRLPLNHPGQGAESPRAKIHNGPKLPSSGPTDFLGREHGGLGARWPLPSCHTSSISE